jgi:hypothetical protein
MCRRCPSPHIIAVATKQAPTSLRPGTSPIFVQAIMVEAMYTNIPTIVVLFGKYFLFIGLCFKAEEISISLVEFVDADYLVIRSCERNNFSQFQYVRVFMPPYTLRKAFPLLLFYY